MNISNLKISVASGLVVTSIVTIQTIVIAPILISSVGIDMYGAWVVVADILVLLQVFDFGITAYGAQKVASAKANNDYARCSANVFATITLIIGLVFFLNLLGFSALYAYDFSAKLSDHEIQILRGCIIIGLMSVSLQLLGYSLIAPSRALEKLTIVNAWAIAGALVGLVLTLILLSAGTGLYAAAIGLSIRSLFNLIGGFLSFRSLRSIIGIRNVRKQAYHAALIDQAKNAPSTFAGNLSLLALSARDRKS